MKAILDLIKQEAIKRDVTVFEILKELELEADRIQEEIDTMNEIQDKLNPFHYYFLDKENIYWIYETETKNDLVPDENGDVYLKPILHYEVFSVKADDLVELSFTTYKRLLDFIDWSEDNYGNPKDGYEDEVEQILQSLK